MNNADAIAALAGAIGLPDLKLDAENTCNIVVDGTQEIYLVGAPDDSRLRLNAVLGDMAALGADPVKMLEVNHVAEESGGGALAINRMTAEAVYIQTLDVSAMEPGTLTAAVERFVKYALFWAETLPELRPAADDRLGTGTTSGEETILRL